MSSARFRRFFLLAVLLCLTTRVYALAEWVVTTDAPGYFPLANGQQVAALVVDKDDFAVVRIAVDDLAADIERVTGWRPAVHHRLKNLNGPVVIAGTLGQSTLIDRLVKNGKLDSSPLQGSWENFVIMTVEQPLPGVEQALVVAGSDRRGTAYGVYELSQAIGVSPWYWWADVAPEKNTSLYVGAGSRQSGSPSVKYRGIFINDEGWGIHQWAAKTFEPENGGIGPKTYQKIFELLLRLKANTLWPAMHPVSKPFNSNPANARLADDYAIVMGSSHAEPMLRNNVGEWTLPHEQYNYLHNHQQVLAYWEARMKSNGHYENIYTLGMRGIHDSSMQGPTDDAGRIDLLQKIFSDQRSLIRRYSKRSPEQVPQMFCAYKEVLALYRQGLVVPDDVTLVWPDDNFGYVRNFASPLERQRSGGFGVYYHISYLGAPMAYLWLNTTPPSLIWQEMSKSWLLGADRLWIVNVGDLKPAEVGTDLFLQMAWNIDRWQRHNIADFLRSWAAQQFGEQHADAIAAVMRDYYQLNYQRKPEHLQWWLPRTSPRPADLTPAEAGERLIAFQNLRSRVEAIRKDIADAHQSAFFQLVAYPVHGSALANIRFLEGERGNGVAAHAADAQLNEETALWNTWLQDGKWKHFMAVEPADGMWDKYRLSPWRMPDITKPVAAPSKGHWQKISAGDFVTRVRGKDSDWEIIPDLGLYGRGSMSVFPVTVAPLPLAKWQEAPRLDYLLDIPETGGYRVQLHLIPTYPITGSRLRLAVAFNDQVPDLLALDVNDGGPEWAQGVLNNTRVISLPVTQLPAGKQRLQVYGLDAGVTLDFIRVEAHTGADH